MMGQNPVEWERNEQRRLLERKLMGMTPGLGMLASTVAPGGGLGPGATVNPYAGMGEDAMLRQFAMSGGVSPAGGFTGPEIPALLSVGIDQDSITAWNEMFKRGLTDDLRKAFGDALREVFGQPTPAANALNP
jgi:hypothetical protein